MDFCLSLVVNQLPVVPLKVEILVVSSASETGMWQASMLQRSLKTGV
jgi:hypothetical protein